MEIYRGVLVLALFGPPAIAVIVPVVSFVLLRRRGFRRERSWPLVLAFSIVCAALSAGATLLFQSIAFGYAWGLAHSKRPAAISGEAAMLAIVCAGLLLLAGCGVVLHRTLIAPRTAS